MDFGYPKAWPPKRFSNHHLGFTLIELLAVISIIALLIGILLPALGLARKSAMASASLSNIRQIGIALANYHTSHNQWYPKHSSPKNGPWDGFANRPRWADYLYVYMQDVRVYRSPLLTGREREDFSKPFAHDPSQTHGGYGYNFQYLGNSRFDPPYHARNGRAVVLPAATFTFGDTAGSRDGSLTNPPGAGAAAVYVLDPPVGSARGSGKGAYYEGGNDEPDGNAETYVWRSFPAQRNTGACNIGFADGHAEPMTMTKMDDFNSDGIKDNGFWNGRGNPDYR